jgi:hypothetical protein
MFPSVDLPCSSCVFRVDVLSEAKKDYFSNLITSGKE